VKKQAARPKRDGYAWSESAKRWIAVTTLPPTKPVKPTARHRRMENAFVQVPLKLAAEAAAASNTRKCFVFLWLLYEAWRLNSTTIPLPNGALKQYGITPKQKMRALIDYEKASLIQVQKTKRQAVTVQLLFQLGQV
jgi:hypothetical protein